MQYVTIEDRVDRLEALFGQFVTESAVLNKRADERNRAAEERMARLENEMRGFKDEMLEFKNEMRGFKDEMLEFKNEMRSFKDEMLEFKNEMRSFKDEMSEFKGSMLRYREESRTEQRAMNRQWGNLANKLGTIIEDILAPNLGRLAVDHFRFPAIDDFMVRRWRRHPADPKVQTDFDTLVVGPDAVILGEAKSSPTVKDAEAFAAKAAVFFEFFPEYAGRRLIPILGSWGMADPVVAALTDRGIYAMRMGDETMELANASALEGGG